MSATNASALRSDASTFVTHVFGRGLQDKTYVVERYRTTIDGVIRPLSGKGHPLTLSLATVRELRPARNEILICKGEKKPDSGIQYWGSGAAWGHMVQRGRFPG